ncbi:MAG: hypothetical protein LBT86_07560 [Deltaproteobacteria bacterium]|nr:hypothetical protein [Deltaproteobacteria bacterium]
MGSSRDLTTYTSARHDAKTKQAPRLRTARASGRALAHPSVTRVAIGSGTNDHSAKRA